MAGINGFTTKTTNMKYILILLLAPLCLFGQQDSIVYEKRINTSETLKGDSVYYKVTYQKQGEVMNIRVEPFTDVDSLMRDVLFNEFTDASRQYKQAIATWEAQEKGYELRLRQAERQYLQFTGEKIKDKVEESFDFDELIGDWELNGKVVEIDAKLEIDKKPIKILSDQQFTVEIDKERQVFNRIKKDRWVSKGEKYVLSKLKTKEKKKSK
jgi:hypothetical protein